MSFFEPPSKILLSLLGIHVDSFDVGIDLFNLTFGLNIEIYLVMESFLSLNNSLLIFFFDNFIFLILLLKCVYHQVIFCNLLLELNYHILMLLKFKLDLLDLNVIIHIFDL